MRKSTHPIDWTEREPHAKPEASVVGYIDTGTHGADFVLLSGKQAIGIRSSIQLGYSGNACGAVDVDFTVYRVDRQPVTQCIGNFA